MTTQRSAIVLDANSVASSWAGWIWPEWVPTELRSQIQSFWADDLGRGPREWLKDSASPYNHHPAFGEDVLVSCDGKRWFRGRYVPAWNNMGRLVYTDERDRPTVQVVSTCYGVIRPDAITK